MITRIFALATLVLSVGCAHPPSAAVAAYNLHAQCGRDARDWLREFHRSTEGNFSHLDYSSHYSQKLNSCFIKIDGVGAVASEISHAVYDVNDNQFLGAIFETQAGELTCFPVNPSGGCSQSNFHQQVIQRYMLD